MYYIGYVINAPLFVKAEFKPPHWLDDLTNGAL